MDTYENRDAETFNGLCGIVCESASEDSCRYRMEVTPRLCQPFGFLHGGATLTLIEATASRAAAERAADDELPFGVGVSVSHKNPGKTGMTVWGIAELLEETPSSSGIGRKQTWGVRAENQDGVVLSEGTFTTKIVPKSYLEAKQAKLRAQNAAAQGEEA